MLHHCFVSFKQSLLDFFKLVESRLVGFTNHIWAVGSQIRKSEIERFGLCCIQDVLVRCLTERQNYYPQCVW